MRSVRLLALAALLAMVCFAGSGLAAQGNGKIRVLLIGGDDVMPYHDPHEISEKTREALLASGRFDVKVCEDAFILESGKALERYDVIVLTMYNAKTPTIPGQAKENLLNFVKNGKGFYVQHLASACFKEWEEFGKLCGRKWVMGTSGHNPRGVFQAKIANKEHPITKGMSNFRIFDELYSKLQGDTDIEVLVSAYSDFSEKEEPLVFVRPYGKGRSVHNALGHDFKAILNPSMQKLICRGVEWAATGKVAD
jgi:type 1 glutamine amidotransferase